MDAAIIDWIGPERFGLMQKAAWFLLPLLAATACLSLFGAGDGLSGDSASSDASDSGGCD